MDTKLTERQQREVDYHKEHAKEHKRLLESPFSWEVLSNPKRRWWNAYWGMYDFLVSSDIKGKKVLIVGCGYGEDALRVAKLGAIVSAFDLSPDSLRIARDLSMREGLTIQSDEMPAEKLDYEDDTFDYVVARDILHHVDLRLTMKEIVRVAKPNSIFLVNEIYSHSVTERIRRSSLVEEIIYPRMRRTIYGSDKPYITEDERKLDEHDLRTITEPLQDRLFVKYFYFLVTRILPERYDFLCKIDRILLKILEPMGPILAGRVLFCGRISKRPRSDGFSCQ